MNLFDSTDNPQNSPLAERLRPQTLKHYVGQNHLVDEGKILKQSISEDSIFSMILWGPPGTGKTTLARIIALETKSNFVAISAVTSNVAEIKKIIGKARENISMYDKKTILFIDEIHRFNKAQQDTLLPHVEKGTVTLIGATTENPSFEVIGPLLSRSRVLTLENLSSEHIKKIVNRALKNKIQGLGNKKLKIEKKAANVLADASGGDARFALNTIEIASEHARNGSIIKLEQIKEALQKRGAIYDKKGDYHYDTISAFIKSMRAGKSDAALHYLSRMIDAGEDPMFIARRMVILASEDIGNANPSALILATSAMQAVHMIGYPEATLILAQAVTYLSESPKSIASTQAIGKAMNEVKSMPLEPIPMHLRNAPTKLMKELGYGKDHIRYPWMPDRHGGKPQKTLEYMPKNLIGHKYYENPKKKK